MTSTERSALGKRFFIHSGRNLIDVARIATHLQSELLPRIEYVDFHHWESAMKRGKGAIGLTGHLGNFELLAAAVHARTGKIGVIGRELSNVQLNCLMLSSRESAGLVNFLTTDSPRRLIKWLRNGGGIGVLIDTDSHRVRGELLPFMGRLSNTPIGHASIALATGAAIVPMTCVRNGDDSYQIIVRPEIQMPLTDDREADTRELTRLCNMALEELVFAYPDQWIWLHNRWHTRPSDTTVPHGESHPAKEDLSESPIESI
jgi:KDO2-lipid IV(A) lauroyltransferase